MIPQVLENGTRFRLWAPYARQVQLRVFDGTQTHDTPMRATGDGFHQLLAPGIGPGTDYQYRVNGQTLPDPASAYQPQGVHGPSRVVDLSSRRWSDGDWQGIPRQDLVVEEIHIGTFTLAGTYSAAIERLDELAELGVTAVELMPLAECPGRWNWGYDGVHLFAPSHNYGSPESLCRFIEACHRRGLAVLLDVVYNHLGPEGNYLRNFGPYFNQQATRWGQSPDFCGPASQPVRCYFKANARHWVQRYHFDGLRFDAIAAMHDASQRHIISEIADEFHALAKTLGRTIHAIGESNLYEPRFLPGGGGRLHAIWSDDIGHAAVGAVTPDRTRGDRSYTGTDDFLKALKQGYLYQRLPDGRSQRATDPPPADLAACVNQLQNHDIIGNSPSGLRIHQQTSHQIQRALAALILLHPSIPLIFMGEEYASNTPFYFFSDFSEEALRQAVVKGRATEFSHHDWNEAVEPTAPEAFYNSRITTRAEGDLETLDWYRNLIKLRKQWLETGLLRAANLEVSGCAKQQFFILNYTEDGTAGFIVSTLHSPAEKLEFSGITRLLHGSGNMHHENDRLRIGPSSSAIGSGTLRLVET